MKTQIIQIILVIVVGVAALIAYLQFQEITKEYEKKIGQARLAGEIAQINNMYQQALSGRLEIRPVLVQDGVLQVDENGQPLRGELIIMIKDATD